MNKKTILRIGAKLGKCAVLGPGKRAVIWVFGCCFSCPGCIAGNFREGNCLEMTPEEAAEWYLQQNADGLTISGGEPMLQAGALAEMIEIIRRVQDCGVIVYTGFEYEALLIKASAEPEIMDFLGAIDLLIDGPYVAEKDCGRPYVGSTNQRLLLLSERYSQDIDNYYDKANTRDIEIHLSPEGTIMAGVPDRNQAKIWENIRDLGDRYGN